MATDLSAILQTLTAYTGGDHLFLSVYLDWVPDGNGQRPSLMALERELDAVAASVAGEPALRASFEADRRRIEEYLDRDAPREARGLAIFACDAASIWYALPLQARVETKIAADRHPHTFQLARLIDDYQTFAVVLAEGQEARLFVVALSDAEELGSTEAPEKIKRFDQGGQAQMLFQRRTDNLIKAHTKDIAGQLDKIVRKHRARHIVIAGNDSIKGMVLDSLSEQQRAMLVDYIHLEQTLPLRSIVEAVEPIMREVERRQEAEALARLEDQMATKGGLAAAGPVDIAHALSKGQVQTLFLLQSFGGSGGECPNCGALRVGQRARCPYDGDELRPVDLREAFTLRAIQQNADVEVIEASDYLARHGGVGALLRWRDDEREVARS